MFDAPFSTYQRSRGSARVSLGRDERIKEMFQQGSAKAMIPRTHGPSPEVVFLNTSGGLTGGDRLEYSLELAAGVTAMAATQTAERAYASPDDVAEVRVQFTLGDGATLAWLPQETILFERAGLARTTDVKLGRGARFLGLETVVLGRSQMGETLHSLDFRDSRRVYDFDDRLLHVEQIQINDDVLRRGADAAGLATATVLATLVLVSADAEDQIECVRRLLPEDNKCIAASAWDGRLIVRAMGHDSWDLRTMLLPTIQYLTGGELPRVWQL